MTAGQRRAVAARDAAGEEEKLAVTPNTVELVPTLGALLPRGGPVQDPVLTAVPLAVALPSVQGLPVGE